MSKYTCYCYLRQLEQDFLFFFQHSLKYEKDGESKVYWRRYDELQEPLISGIRSF